MSADRATIEMARQSVFALNRALPNQTRMEVVPALAEEIVPHKRCSSCLEDKPLTEFYKRGDSDKYRSHCRTCLKRDDAQKARRRELHEIQPERHILGQMIQRCHNPSNPGYSDYGGRGIRVCDRWRESFEAFLADVGPRPTPEHSIDRYPDNNGNYEPGNVRWATDSEQRRNYRQNALLTIDGTTRCRVEWAEIAGIDPQVIRDRTEKLGWDAKRAVFTPTRRCERRAT